MPNCHPADVEQSLEGIHRPLLKRRGHHTEVEQFVAGLAVVGPSGKFRKQTLQGRIGGIHPIV